MTEDAEAFKPTRTSWTNVQTGEEYPLSLNDSLYVAARHCLAMIDRHRNWFTSSGRCEGNTTEGMNRAELHMSLKNYIPDDPERMKQIFQEEFR